MITPLPCAEKPELFFPESYDDRLAIGMAKRICAGCPRTQACLQEALDFEESIGIWGATTPGERHRLLRPRRARVAA